MVMECTAKCRVAPKWQHEAVMKYFAFKSKSFMHSGRPAMQPPGSFMTIFVNAGPAVVILRTTENKEP